MAERSCSQMVLIEFAIYVCMYAQDQFTSYNLLTLSFCYCTCTIPKDAVARPVPVTTKCTMLFSVYSATASHVCVSSCRFCDCVECVSPAEGGGRGSGSW